MQAEFWNKLWKKDTIDFHELEPNPRLVKYFDCLKLTTGKQIFIPLCGKTLDIAWLANQGYCVVGVEFIETAVKQLFEEMQCSPEITSVRGMKLYQAENIRIFVGDFFDLDAQTLGETDAIFDRGSLVALPEKMRYQYATHLTSITNSATQLLLCFEYDQNLADGPPFSISAQELNQHYADDYCLQCLETIHEVNKFSTNFKITEKVWLLK